MEKYIYLTLAYKNIGKTFGKKMAKTLFRVIFFLYKTKHKNGNNFEYMGIILRILPEVYVRIPA